VAADAVGACGDDSTVRRSALRRKMAAGAIRLAVGAVYPPEGARIAFVRSHFDGRIRPDSNSRGALLAVSPLASTTGRCPHCSDDLGRINVR
jgi:hypothetical protein